MDSKRQSGILLHITSLSSDYGIGDLGPAAYRFADFLTRTEQRIWQVLPVGPVGRGASPYSSASTFAGSPLLISPEPLVEYGLLDEDDLAPLAELPDDHVDYERLVPRKHRVLRTAYQRFEAEQSSVDTSQLEQFRRRQSSWINDYALFAALREVHGSPWTHWPTPLARRDTDALAEARDEHADAVRRHTFWQYLFHRQWTALQAYCRPRNVQLFGDLPIYVAHDSADVWAHQELFKLDDQGEPAVVAGVPPDYFSSEGQRWGNPIYRWDRMEEAGWNWWTERLRQTFARFDLVRLDHFRGFEAYWEIPAESSSAIKGEWRDGPGPAFFRAMENELGELPVVAEDLGVITEEVDTLREIFGYPGMSVLQFAFETDPTNEFLPHNYERNLVAYPGTHDNNTTVGWWCEDVGANAKSFAQSYLDLPSPDIEIHRECMRTLMASVADRVVIPMQDVMGLGSEARMNTPGETEGNWSWRFTPDQISKDDEEMLTDLTVLYGRARTYQ